MTVTRRDFIKTAGVAIAATQLTNLTGASAAETNNLAPAPPKRRKVIFDQDNAGPMGTDIQGLLMLLQADNIDLLGITIVTGDAWLKQELAYTLRLLEMMGRTEVPVYAGAEFPLINTKEEALLRYDLFGGHRLDPHLGAFNRGNTGPDVVQPLAEVYGRFAELKPQQEHAARFIINTVRKYPGEVTLYVGGPLTNLALAIKLAPDIVALVPEVVFMGAGFHHFTNAFNVFFDPEAAKIALRAPWPKFTVVTVDLAEEIHMFDELRPGRLMVEEIVEKAQSPLKELFSHSLRNFHTQGRKGRGFRIPDEMMSAQIIDPTIFTKSDKFHIDINTTPGPRYGDSMLWDPADGERAKLGGTTPQWFYGPPPSAGVVNVLLEVDHDRMKKLFVELMTKPVRKPSPATAA